MKDKNKDMVRISVRLSEEENEKLKQNSALCGLTQSEYVRQLCKGMVLVYNYGHGKLNNL